MTDTTSLAQAGATTAESSITVDAPNTTQPASRPRDESGKFAATDKTQDPAPLSAEAAKLPEDSAPAADAETTDPVKADGEKDKKKRSADDRIKQITAQKYEAIARAERAEKKALELHRQLQDFGPPSDDLDPVQDMRRAVKIENFEQSKAELADARSAKQQASAAEFYAKVDAVRETIPDIEAALKSFGNVPLSNDACDVLASSPKAAEIAYFIGQNPSEGHRIAALPNYQQAAEIARLENRLTTPKAKTVSTAPKPAATLGGGVNPLQFDAMRASSDDMAAHLRKAGIIR